MFGSICPCGVEGFAWLDKREIFVLSDSTCVYERAGQRIRHQLAKDEAEEATKAQIPPVHADVSPSILICAGINLEDQQ